MARIDPLRLAAGQRPGLPGEREVAETHAQQEGELGIELAQDLAGHDVLPGAETEVAEETGRGVDRERGELGDRESGHADRQRGGLEPGAAADLAHGLAAIAREEDAHVELVPVRLDLLEEPLDAREGAVAGVDELADGVGKLSHVWVSSRCRRAAFISSRWYQRPDGCVQGSTAPSARLRVRSGTTSASSYLRTLPNPLHSGHAPRG